MKRMFTWMAASIMAITVQAQTYDVGTSTTSTDYFGNQKTTHKDRYGQTTGSSTSSTDMFGKTTTTHRDRYGKKNRNFHNID